jgi:hypothetical protein
MVYATDVVALLSMDITVPFYERMGLALSPAERLPSLMRVLLDTNRNVFASAELSTLSGFLDAVLATVSEAYRPAVAERFRLWMLELPYPDPSNDPWACYLTPFLGRSKWLDRARFGHRTDQIRRAFMRAREMGDVLADVAASKARPLSQWDNAVYALRRYNNDQSVVQDANDAGDGTVMRYPYAPIETAIERDRFQQFWEGLLELATDEELTEIRRDAEAFWKKPLPEPRRLRRVPWP